MTFSHLAISSSAAFGSIRDSTSIVKPFPLAMKTNFHADGKIAVSVDLDIESLSVALQSTTISSLTDTLNQLQRDFEDSLCGVKEFPKRKESESKSSEHEVQVTSPCPPCFRPQVLPILYVEK